MFSIQFNFSTDESKFHMSGWAVRAASHHFEFYADGVYVFRQKLMTLKACIYLLHLSGSHYFIMKTTVSPSLEIFIITFHALQLIVVFGETTT